MVKMITSYSKPRMAGFLAFSFVFSVSIYPALSHAFDNRYIDVKTDAKSGALPLQDAAKNQQPFDSMMDTHINALGINNLDSASKMKLMEQNANGLKTDSEIASAIIQPLGRSEVTGSEAKIQSYSPAIDMGARLSGESQTIISQTMTGVSTGKDVAVVPISPASQPAAESKVSKSTDTAKEQEKPSGLAETFKNVLAATSGNDPKPTTANQPMGTKVLDNLAELFGVLETKAIKTTDSSAREVPQDAFLNGGLSLLSTKPVAMPSDAKIVKLIAGGGKDVGSMATLFKITAEDNSEVGLPQGDIDYLQQSIKYGDTTLKNVIVDLGMKSLVASYAKVIGYKFDNRYAVSGWADRLAKVFNNPKAYEQEKSKVFAELQARIDISILGTHYDLFDQKKLSMTDGDTAYFAAEIGAGRMTIQEANFKLAMRKEVLDMAKETGFKIPSTGVLFFGESNSRKSMAARNGLIPRRNSKKVSQFGLKFKDELLQQKIMRAPMR